MIALDHLFALLPQAQIEQLACTYEIDTRTHARLPGPAVFLCLLTALLHHPELSQRLLEETYRLQTGRTTDHSSWGQCLNKLPPTYFAALSQALHIRLSAEANLTNAAGLRVGRIDATTVTLSAKLLRFGLTQGTNTPDKTRRAVKSVVALGHDGLPQLLKVCKDPAEANDCVAIGDALLAHAQPGELWLFDAGCHDRHRLLRLHQAGSYWLTPHHQQALQPQRTLYEADPSGLPTTAPDKGEADFVIGRVQQAVFGNSQESRKQQAAFHTMPLLVVEGLRWDKRGKSWQPLTLLSNLPLSEDGQRAGPYTWEEVAALYRSRWDIEVFFRFIKQHLSYAHLLSRSENGIQILIYMSLIAAMLLIWYKQQTGIDRGWRSVKFWLAEDVREWTHEVITTLQFLSDS